MLKMFVSILRIFDFFGVPLNILILKMSKMSRARTIAAWYLGEANLKLAVTPLIKALRDKDTSVRGQAARSLSILGDKTAITALEWMRDNDDEELSDGTKLKDIAIEAINSINRNIRKSRSVDNIGWP